jgi:hypothetical protein
VPLHLLVPLRRELFRMPPLEKELLRYPDECAAARQLGEQHHVVADYRQYPPRLMEHLGANDSVDDM